MAKSSSLSSSSTSEFTITLMIIVRVFYFTVIFASLLHFAYSRHLVAKVIKLRPTDKPDGYKLFEKLVDTRAGSPVDMIDVLLRQATIPAAELDNLVISTSSSPSSSAAQSPSVSPARLNVSLIPDSQITIQRRYAVPEEISKRAVLEPLIDEFLRDIIPSMTHPRNLKVSFRAPELNLRKICMYVTIKDNLLNIDVEENMRSSHPRFKSIETLLTRLVDRYVVPDVEFMVMLNDGNRPPVTVFGSARHWNASTWKLLLPVPIGNERGKDAGFATSFAGWDNYIDYIITGRHNVYPWDKKLDKAVFRGSFVMQTHALASCNGGNLSLCNPATHWRRVNRGVLYSVTQMRQDLFDVAFTSKHGKVPELVADVPVEPDKFIPFPELMKYKYVLNVGANQDWTERLRSILFMNSAVIRHEAETLEWFYPLLKPYVHYIPTDIMMSDLVQVVEWAKMNDEKVRQIVKNANQFAKEFLCENVMLEYVLIAIQKFSELQKTALETII